MQPIRLWLALLISSVLAPAAVATSTSGSDPIEGVWTGTITAPQGTGAAFGLDFFRDSHGKRGFRLNFPEMFVTNQSLGIPVESDGDGTYRITPVFAIVLHRDGDRLTGTFGAGKLPLSLSRGGTFPGLDNDPTPPAGPKPLWLYELGSGTWAAPVVADGVVYVGTSAGTFHAVRAADGARLWTWTGAASIEGRAVVSGSLVLFVDTQENLVALDQAKGSLRWRTGLHDAKLAGHPVPSNPTFNHRAATPLALDGVVYCGSSDGGLYALDEKTGSVIWRHDAGAPVYSGISVVGGALAFGTMDGSVVLLDRRTQKETFRAKTEGGIVTTPLVTRGRVVVGSRDYEIHAFNLADGSVDWRYSYWFSWVESTPVLVDGLIYIGASDYSRVTAIDPATGRPRWSTKVHGMNWGTPLVTSDRVFTGTASQNIRGTLIAHQGGIVALDRATGRALWRFAAAPAPEGGFGGYAGSLALCGDKIIAAGFDGKLIALPAK